MQMKDATRSFGSVALFIPLILIFLTAADSAFACPGQNTGVVYRTRSTNMRTVSYMPTTVITYRAPDSYRRCGDNMYDTRGRRYVAVRSSRYYNDGGERYATMRESGYYRMPRTRYVAVRNVDYDYEPRYVAVRPRYPVYRIDDSRYAEIRSGYRRNNGIVRVIDFQDEPRHVAVSRFPDDERYVSVHRDYDYYDRGRSNYVAIRKINSGCGRPVALRSCSDQVGTTSVRRVVLRNDDEDDYPVRVKRVDFDDDDDIAYSASTRNVVINDDDDDDIAVENDAPRYVEYRDAAYSDEDSEDYSEAPEAISGRTIVYDPVSYDMNDDQAFLDNDNVTYVAETEDACMPRAVVHRIHRSPTIVRMRAVSYVPVEDVDDVAYIEPDDAAPLIRQVASVEHRDFDDSGPTYVDDEKASYAQVSDDECPAIVSSMRTEPVYVADDVEESALAYPSSAQIATHYGYRDGFEDGQEAALERDAYHPENSGDFQKATEGYESDFGDKDVYRDVYRDSYLRGYRAGFRSVGAG